MFFQIWKNNPQSRILICAPSNSATNEIAVRLAEKVSPTDLFRLIGNVYGQDRKLAELGNFTNIDNNGTVFMPPMEKIFSYRILLTTLVTAAR